jgi:iron complex outermembrane receptor protein
MSNVTKLSDAIKFALFVGAASSAASVTAFAQEKEEAKTLDRVEVTGSRIKRVDAETTQPVAVVSRADIEKSGLTNVFDILNNITSSDGSGLSTTTTQTNGSDGSQQISLRGLGADRTLVLVDGKRWVTDLDGTVDLSTIPVAIIERIDVLKDGASAIYGSDAIAGVVNIITRKNFEGAQFGMSYGQTAKGDGAQRAADLTIGAAGERASGVMSLSYSEQEEIMAGDRYISTEPYYECTKYFQNIYGPSVTACPYGSGSNVWGRFSVGGSNRTMRPDGNYSDGYQLADTRAYSGFTDAYNYSPVNYLQQPAQRLNLFAAGRFQVTDSITAYTRVNYTKRYSNQQLAEVPVTASVAGANGPQWRIPVDVAMPFNPFGVTINTWNHRSIAVGPRNPTYDYDIFSMQLGLEGSFEIGERYFSWDLTAQRNDGQYDTKGTGYLNLFNLKNAVGVGGYDATSNSLYCGASYATRILGCIPYNVFGGPNLGLGTKINGAPAGRVVTAAEVQQMINYVSYTQVGTAGNTSTGYSGNLTGDLFELPAGMLSFAVGFETRKDLAFDQPDALVMGGGSSDNFSEPTRGQTSVTEYFGEITAPLLKDVFLAKELEVRAALRKSDYAAQGFVGPNFTTNDPGSPTNAMYGLKWKPIDDLMFRFSMGESFRAPSAVDLYGGGGESFPQVTDPCRSNVAGTAWNSAANAAACTAAGLSGPNGFGVLQSNPQIRTLVGGDANLKPEYGDTMTYGFVYSPSWVEGLDLTVDYWEVDLFDLQTTLSAGNVMARCVGTSGFTPDATFCANVVRDAAGSVTQVRTARTNLARYRASGIDLGAVYRWDAGDWGNFRFALDTSWLENGQSFNSTLNVWNPSEVGTYTGSPSFEYRNVATIDWSKGDYSVRWTTRTMTNIYEGCFLYCNDYDDSGKNNSGFYAVHDLNLAWKAPWDATIAVGARNLFGKEPPIFTNNTFAHSFDAAYDLPGGAYWYMSYRQDF